MLNKIILLMLVMSSTAYAEISYVTIDDVKDHSKIVSKLNELISQINSSTKSIQTEQVAIKQEYISTSARVAKLEPIAVEQHTKVIAE